MFRKSLHEYIFAQQSNDDIYSKYREHKTRMYQSVNEATITKEIEAVYLPTVAAVLQKEIQKILNT